MNLFSIKDSRLHICKIIKRSGKLLVGSQFTKSAEDKASKQEDITKTKKAAKWNAFECLGAEADIVERMTQNGDNVITLGTRNGDIYPHLALFALTEICTEAIIAKLGQEAKAGLQRTRDGQPSNALLRWSSIIILVLDAAIKRTAT